jgi:hypothetical protein
MESSLSDRQFNRAYVSMHDMDRCVESLECAAAALEHQDDKAARGLLTAAIVCYARPFSGNADHPRATASPSFRVSRLSKEERVLHHHVLELRNKAIAHSDAERNPVKLNSSSATVWVADSNIYDPLAEVGIIQQFHALAVRARAMFATETHRAASSVAP